MKITVPIKRGRPTKKGAGTLGKTEVLQFRLDPKSRFSMELAARYQKRTLSSAFDIAVESYIQSFRLKTANDRIVSFTLDSDTERPLTALVDKLWDESEAVRLINTAQLAPELLSPEEKLIWRVITNQPLFWRSVPNSKQMEPFIALIERMWVQIKEAQTPEELDVQLLSKVFTELNHAANPEKLKVLLDALADFNSIPACRPSAQCGGVRNFDVSSVCNDEIFSAKTEFPK